MEPADRAADDAADGRSPKPEEVRAAEGWTDEQLGEYLRARIREQLDRQPVGAPLRWPASVLIIALRTVIGGIADLAGRQERWNRWLIDLVEGLVDIWPLEIADRLERRRARELGVLRGADLPERRLRWPVLPPNERLTPYFATSTDLLLRPLLSLLGIEGAERLLRRAQRRPRPRRRWEIFLANQLCRDLLRRYDWR